MTFFKMLKRPLAEFAYLEILQEAAFRQKYLTV